MGEPLSEPMTGKTKIRTKNKNLISDNCPPSEFDVLAACLHRCCLAAFVFLYSGFYNDVLSFNKGEVKLTVLLVEVGFDVSNTHWEPEQCNLLWAEGERGTESGDSAEG